MILAVACEPPEKSGIPRSHRTHASLADEVKTLGLLADISARHVGRLLKDGGPEAATGRVIESIVEATRTGADFPKRVGRTIATDPEAGWVSAADNY